MAEKIVNYTQEQTNQLVTLYNRGEPVELIADTLGKSVRSVVAKLSREGVYKAKARTQTARVRKADLVDQLAKACGATSEQFDSLEKANLEVLEVLVNKLK
jgi:hypothetical protein